MSHRAPATIPADFGGANTQRTVAPPDRAFGAVDKESEGTIIVHFSVLSEDNTERIAVARIIEAQLKSQRVGSKDITFLITASDVSAALMDTGPLEAKITAKIMQRLGIK